MQSNRRSEFKLFPLVLTLFLFTLLAIFIRVNLYSIPPLDDSAPDNVFSAGRANNYLEHLIGDQKAHPVDSVANDLVASRLIKTLEQLGYKPEIQDSRICQDSSRGFVRCVRVKNIIVHIVGTESDKEQKNGILLSAHYDSVPAAPGGSDAGAAVATLIEIARLMSKQSQPKNSIVLLFNEGEEFGLFGARAFMQGHPLAEKLKLAINIEARGSQGQSVMFETGEDSGWLVDIYNRTSPAPLTSSLFYEVYKFLPNDTDLTIFKRHGLQGLNFAHAEQLPHYHTPLDNLENLDRGSLQHHGDNVWRVLNELKNKDFSNTAKGNLVYTDILGKYVISWPESWTLWFVLLLWGAFISITVSIARRKGFKSADLIKGLVGQIVLVVAGGFIAWLLQQGATIIGDHYQPWYAHDLAMRLAIWFGVIGFSILLLRWISAKASIAGMVIGIILSWLGFATLLTFTLPGIAFLFILPVVFSLLVLGVFAAFFSQTEENGQSLMAMTICLGSSIVILPVVYVLEIMVGFSMSLALGIVLAFSTVTFAPLLTGSPPNRSRIFSKTRLTFSHVVLMTMFFSASSLVWVCVQSPYSEWSPQPMNFNYVQTEDSTNESAEISIGSRGSILPDSINKKLSEITIKQNLPWSFRHRYTAPIGSEKLAHPQITMSQISDPEESSGSKIISLKIESSSDKLSDIQVYIPLDIGLKQLKAAEERFDYQGERSRTKDYYQYHCRGRSCQNQSLILEFDERDFSDSDHLLVVEYRQGLPENLKELANLRGATATQRQAGDQSILISKIYLKDGSN